jgi:hypothetical protein
MKDMGCDGIMATTATTGSQIEQVQMSDTAADCYLLVPDANEDSEGEMQSEVPCFKCNGSQVNKKGLPCRKCKGTGVLVNRDISDAVDVIKDDVAEFCKENIKAMFVEYLVLKQAQQEEQIHEEIECDVCGMCPIKGIRYKSAVLPDYDLCQNCEKKGEHADKPLIKIRNAKQANFKFVCRMEKPETPAKTHSASAKTEDPSKSLASNVRYSGRFVRESMKEFAEIEAGSSFSKTFTFRNDEKSSWPKFVKLCQSSGDSLCVSDAICLKEVKPNEEVDLTV